jgi:uncharacterized protein (TIGR00297 family)
MSFTARVFEYLLLSLFIAPLSLKFAGMDKRGSVAALFVGFVVYVSMGLKGFLVLLSLHIIGATVTRMGFEKKLEKGIAQKKRSLENVIANGLFPALAAALSALSYPNSAVFFIGYVSTVAAATADTVSSEIGELSRKKPRLITSFEEVPTGTDGGITLLGTLAGILGAGLIALFAVALDFKVAPIELFVIATFAGVLGTSLDSFLGATLERKGKIGNDMVNLISTGVSFLASMGIYSYLS